NTSPMLNSTYSPIVTRSFVPKQPSAGWLQSPTGRPASRKKDKGATHARCAHACPSKTTPSALRAEPSSVPAPPAPPPTNTASGPALCVCGSLRQQQTAPRTEATGYCSRYIAPSLCPRQTDCCPAFREQHRHTYALRCIRSSRG